MGIYDEHKPESGGSGLYLKLEDGQTARLRIASEPVIYSSEFRRGDEVTLSTRYAWVVWNVEDEVPQVWQGSATFFKNLANYANDPEYGDPTEYDIKITRDGTGTDTVYNITPGRNSYKLDPEAKAKCDKLDLPELIRKGKSNSSIFWLSDFISDGAATPNEAKPSEPQSGYEKAKAKADEIKTRGAVDKTPDTEVKPQDDVVFEDIGDEPINLDDIPF